MNRRNLLKGAAAIAAALVFRPALSLGNAGETAAARLAALERRHGGRLGVAILDTGNGRHVGYRADERFLMCSTFKLLAVAAVLARVDRGAERLDRRIVFDKKSVLAWAPVTSHRIGPPGMSVAELCQAAITVSDNTAANLLLASLGGPAAVTSCARGLGDPLTRLDRVEPELNVGAPGDVRDTTTPNAMLADLRTLLLGNALSVTSRRQLAEWLRATRTGADKLRAGLPSGWQVGDKTGSGAHGESNDIAIIWPPQRKPLLVAAYYAASSVDGAGSDAVLAEAGRIAASL
ncbi:class A beta-lactamase [Rhodanobacter koreensis]